MLERIGDILSKALALVFALFTAVAFVGGILFLIYKLLSSFYGYFIAGFLGPDPAFHAVKLLAEGLMVALVLGSIYAFIRIGAWAYERFPLVQRVIGIASETIAVAVAVLFLVMTLSQCMSGETHCTPSRYIDC